jgi:hypothetical protein
MTKLSQKQETDIETHHYVEVKQEKLVGPAGKMQVEVNGSSGSIFFYTFELKGAMVGKGKLILVK